MEVVKRLNFSMLMLTQRKSWRVLPSIFRILKLYYLIHRFVMAKNYHPNSAPFVIVGGGISGIQAACNLAEMGQRFILLEANSRLGGRICTLTIEEALREDGVEIKYPWLDKVKGKTVEVGATWICEDNASMFELAKKHKIALHPQYYKGKNIFALGEKDKRAMGDYSEYYRKHQDRLVPMVMKIWRIQGRYWHLMQLKREGKIKKEEEQELRGIHQKYDSMSAYEFILGEVKDQFLANLVDNELITLQAITTKEFTAIHFILDDSGMDGLFYYLGLDSDNIDGYRAENGIKELLTTMKDHALRQLKRHGLPHKEENIFRLSHPVGQIRNKLNPVEVVTTSGETFFCDKVLLAVPSGTMKYIQFDLLSEGKRLLIENQLNSWCVRMNIVFPEPFWRKGNFSGNVNFSHEFLMNELVDLSPNDLSCGILAFVFFKEGYLKWKKQIDVEASLEDEQERKRRMYELNKTQCLNIIADLYLKGDTGHPHLKECEIFTRSLSWDPYIRDTFDSTAAPGKIKELYQRGLLHDDPQTSDEHNIIMLGSDFAIEEDAPGYMEGAVNIANRKINKCLRPKL